MIREHYGRIEKLLSKEELKKMYDEIILNGNDKLLYLYCYQYDDVPGFRDRDGKIEFGTFDAKSFNEESGKSIYSDHSSPFCNGYIDYSYWGADLQVDRSKFDKLDIEQQYQLIRYCLYKSLNRL